MRKTEPDLYRVLGVPRNAIAADITSAYRRQARAWHPDMAPAAAGAAARFRAVAEAYQVLSDPARRAGYDRARQGHAVPGPARPGPVTSPAGVRPAGRSAAGSPHPTAAPALWAGPVRVDPLPRATADVSPHRAEDPGPSIWAVRAPAPRRVPKLAMVNPSWADLDQGLFSISIAAEITGLHPQTLRLYEREGLLDQPAVPGAPGATAAMTSPGCRRSAGWPALASTWPASARSCCSRRKTGTCKQRSAS